MEAIQVYKSNIDYFEQQKKNFSENKKKVEDESGKFSEMLKEAMKNPVKNIKIQNG